MLGAHRLCCILCLFVLVTELNRLNSADARSIGAIVDNTSRAGKEETVAMKMAIEDFNSSTGRHGAPALHIKDSRGDPVRAASAALSLINDQQVHALVGLQTWQEASFVAEIGTQAQVPVLSFTKASPPLALERWPFLIRIAHNQTSQMRAIAAIVGSWQFRRVTIVYEDVDYAVTSIIPHLADALRIVGSEIDHRQAIPPSSSKYSLRDKLDILKSRQCRVFIVHTSAKMASELFLEANKMGMMDKEYVWITTNEITSLLDSLDASTIASMQGVLGVRNNFSPSSRTSDFIARFKKRFHLEYPELEDKEASREPQYQALLAYDAVWAVALAIDKISPSTSSISPTKSPKLDETIQISVSSHGQELLEEVRRSNFHGKSGDSHFEDGDFAPPRAFQLVNVVGKSCTELGFWSHEHGFSRRLEKREGGGASMRLLGPIIWPGRPWEAPRGWAPTNDHPLKVAVSAKSVFRDFVSATYNSNLSEPSVEGFSINVFKAAVQQLHYDLPYKFVLFNGSYDSLMEHDHMMSYDVLVGDTSISSGRYHFVEFSQPYTESGLVMVVPLKLEGSSRDWIFLKPFTPTMWLLIVAIGLYNGIVIWLIERKFNSEYRVGFWQQVSTVFWLSFTTLLSPGEKLQSSLSRVAMVVWLSVLVMLTMNYTASLSSLLTVQRLEEVVTVESLKSSGAMVGCTNGSVVAKYLEEVLLFPRHNIRKFSLEEDYYHALSSGNIKAAFLRASHAKVLLAKYCNELTTTGVVYHVGGLGFVFPKGSPLLSDISQAILKVFENGIIQKLESAMLSAYNCSSMSSSNQGEDVYRLSPESFSGLFAITLLASTGALTVYGVFFHHDTCGGKRKQNGECSAIQLAVSTENESVEKHSTIDHGGHMI